MKKVFQILMFVALLNYGEAQTNIVPNGGFESYSICPNGVGQLENVVNDWYNPNTSSPDYFNSCCGCSTGVGANVPNTGIGFQNANSGNAFSGIYVYQQPNGREYIGVQLSETLIFNHKYYCEFFVSLSDLLRYGTSRVGAFFSSFKLTTGNPYTINVIPQIQNPFGNFLSDKTNWMKVSGSFIASGGEQWLTIGNFYDDLNTDTSFVTSSSYKEAYYFIEDVSVIDSTAIGIKEQEKHNAKLHVFPNPAKEEITIEFSELKKGNLVVTDINGKIVMQKSFEARLLQLDVSTLEAGVYFAEAILDDGKRLRQKVVKLAD